MSKKQIYLKKQLVMMGDPHQTVKLMIDHTQYEFSMQDVIKALLYLLGETDE